MIITPEIAALILQCLIKYGPDVARAITVIFHKKEPTLEDWNAAFDLAKNPIVQVSDVPKFADDVPGIPLPFVSGMQVVTNAPESNT